MIGWIFMQDPLERCLGGMQHTRNCIRLLSVQAGER